MTWTRLSPADAERIWDAELGQFADHSLYQSQRWGTYKRFRGWEPHYFRAEAGGAVVAMLQALVRRYPWRTVVAWCPGGAVGSLDVCTNGAMKQLASLLGARALYCRCSFARAKTTQDEMHLEANGWARPARTLSANLTAVWDLRPSEDQLLAGLNRNWRYSLRQAHKSGLVVQRLDPPPVHELAELSSAMRASKGTAAVARSAELAALFDALGDRAAVFGCRGDSGRLMAFHSCAVQGSRAWELVAATSPEGRDASASFAVLWSLILHCRRMQVTHYDLAGLDPAEAAGVASFKRWTGAQDVEWLGEWEWSTSPVLRRMVDSAVSRRTPSALP